MGYSFIQWRQFYLSSKALRGPGSIAHCSEGHQPPPEAVIEGPAPGLRSLSLNGKDEAGVEEDGHNHDHKQQAKLWEYCD